MLYFIACLTTIIYNHINGLLLYIYVINNIIITLILADLAISRLSGRLTPPTIKVPRRSPSFYSL